MTLLALISTMEARACGGFGCNLAVPVLQNAERIVFGLDEETVEMHVQITYEGAAEDFAWIVPVPADPDIFVTTAALFSQLQIASAPLFQLQNVDEGLCRDGGGFGFVQQDFALAAPKASSTASSTGAVNVIAREAVGPYDTVTLEATSVAALLTWLDDNGYELPPNSDAAIEPYIAKEGAYFVALKLQKDKDAGDLAPLGLRYPAAKAMIPVQLTSVSATPDMRMEVYVFGATRAVPESYLHVQINEAAVDWWNFGQNYFDVITQAADQAGGHAFATDLYGEADIAGTFFLENEFSEAALRNESVPEQWLASAMQAMAVIPPELVAVVQDQLGLNEDAAQLFVQCFGGCVDGARFVNGVDVATDDLMERVVEPLRGAQALVATHSKLTRMTSSLDAVEMVVDPVFVLNADMRDTAVSSSHTAEQVFECGNGKVRENADRRLVLANGIEIALPSQRWFERNGITEIEYLEELGENKALIIEETGATGQPLVLVDHTADLVALVANFNRLVGCGCAQTSTGSFVPLLGLAALAWGRRRR